jgi:hypothetical protein
MEMDWREGKAMKQTGAHLEEGVAGGAEGGKGGGAGAAGGHRGQSILQLSRQHSMGRKGPRGQPQPMVMRTAVEKRREEVLAHPLWTSSCGELYGPGVVLGRWTLSRQRALLSCTRFFCQRIACSLVIIVW